MLGSSVFRTGVAPGGALAGPWVRNPLWVAARAVPSLDLRFAENKSLVDATTGQNLVTFTRASSGTYVGSDGLIKTATTNLLLRSEEFDDAYWTKSNLQAFGSGSIANVIAAPNGTITADKIVENTVNAQHMVFRGITPEGGLRYTFSFYAKAAERSFAIAAFSGGGLASDCTVGINLTNGSIVSTSNAPDIATAVLVGDGWYRVVLSKTLPSSSTVQSRIVISTNGTAQAYTGDGTSGIYLWGAQLEQSSTVGEYIPTTSTINSAPRFDHNPTTGESLGLLVEEQRTNSIRNNTMVGAVAGTPGTLPTNWGEALTGLTRQVVGVGTQNGIDYIDLRFFGILAGTQLISRWDGITVAVANGQTWTLSAWVSLISGTLPSSNVVLSANLYTSGSSYIGDITLGQIKPLISNTFSRLSGTGTINAATAALARPYIYFLGANGEAIDFTLRIGMPQFEQGAFATSVIPTTTATVTRSADVASITGSNFSSWYRQDEGTVFSEFSAAAYSTASYAISDGTNNNRIMVDRGSIGTRYAITNAGAAQTGGAQTPYVLNSFARSAFGFALNNCNLAVNGTTQTVDTSASIPSSVDRLLLGVNAGGSGYGNGPIKRIAFWRSRLSDSTLASMTQ